MNSMMKKAETLAISPPWTATSMTTLNPNQAVCEILPHRNRGIELCRTVGPTNLQHKIVGTYTYNVARSKFRFESYEARLALGRAVWKRIFNEQGTGEMKYFALAVSTTEDYTE